jgi:hypothetical protein
VSSVEGRGEELIVTWPSVAGKAYDIRKTMNLVNGFGAMEASGLVATPPVNTYTADTSQAASGYYRITLE